MLDHIGGVDRGPVEGKIVKFKKSVIALVAGAALAGSVVIATPAMAATASPAAAQSCAKPFPVNPSLVSKTNSHVKWSASGTCSSANTFQVLLKHYYAPPFSDPTAGSAYDYTSPWSAGDNTCDGGGTTQYYTRASFFIQGSADVIQNSATVTVNDHC